MKVKEPLHILSRQDPEDLKPGYLPGDTLEAAPDFDGSGDGDPEAGCGCGENCNRTANDPCPLEELAGLANRREITLDRLKYAGVEIADTLEHTLREMWKEDFDLAWQTLCKFGPRIKEQKVENK
jgi:hypothetical protein